MEVYGTKPKRFTKEWWGYFWYYYKWHTLAVVFASFLIIYSSVQCAMQPKYDLHIDYISEFGLTEESEKALTELMCANIDDINGNDKIDAFVLNLNMNESADVQMTQAMQAKLMLEMGYSDSYVFIMTKKYADMFTENDVLKPVSEWLGTDADGMTVSLADSDALADIGIDAKGQDLYVGVRPLRDKDDKPEDAAEYENGVKFAKYLIDRE